MTEPMTKAQQKAMNKMLPKVGAWSCQKCGSTKFRRHRSRRGCLKCGWHNISQ